MNKYETHREAMKQVVARLKENGITVTKELERTKGRYHLILGGGIRIAIVGAWAGHSTHQVKHRNKQRKRCIYHYRYQGWNFNFHNRGKLFADDFDFVVCVLLTDEGGPRFFVIPRSAVDTQVFRFRKNKRKAYAGRYAPYENAWDVVRGSNAA